VVNLPNIYGDIMRKILILFLLSFSFFAFSSIDYEDVLKAHKQFDDFEFEYVGMSTPDIGDWYYNWAGGNHYYSGDSFYAYFKSNYLSNDYSFISLSAKPVYYIYEISLSLPESHYPSKATPYHIDNIDKKQSPKSPYYLIGIAYLYSSNALPSDVTAPTKPDVVGEGSDSDGDGYSDPLESALGTDSNNPADHPIGLNSGDADNPIIDGYIGKNGGIYDDKGNQLSPPHGDFDNDGIGNKPELDQGSDPNDPTDPNKGDDFKKDSDGDGIPDIYDKDPNDGSNPSSTPWDKCPTGTNVYDARTGILMGTIASNGDLIVKGSDGFTYSIPRKEWMKKIPMQKFVPDDNKAWGVFPQKDDNNNDDIPEPDVPDSSTARVINNITNNNDNSTTNNNTTNNNDNSTTNNYTTDFDTSGIESKIDTTNSKLDDSNNHLKDLNDKLDKFFEDGVITDVPIGGDSSFDPDNFSDVFLSIKTNFTTRKTELMSKVPSFLKGDFLPQNVQTTTMPYITIPILKINEPIWPTKYDKYRFMLRDVFGFLCYLALFYGCWKVLAGGNS